MKKGWTYKKLGDVGTFVRGGNFSKKDFIENGFPCIHYGQIHMKFGIETFKHLSSVPVEMVKSDRCAHKGDLVIAITSEDDAGSCKCTAWMGDYDVYVGGHTAIYRHTMKPKYVSYYFMSPNFQKDKLEFTHGFKVVEINPKDIAKISIPVPPLPEQQRIVEYLDSAFAKIDAMKTNAQKALDEAKALFQVSLKEMLKPKEDWGYRKFESCLVRVPKQRQINKKEYKSVGRFPIVSQESELISGYWNDENILYRHEKPIVIFGDHTKIIKYIDFDFVVGADGTHILSTKSDINVKFFYYALKSIVLRDLGYARHYKLLKEKYISIPPLPEQQRIVAALDSIKSKVDRLQENFDKISQECDALKQAILRQVFE